MYSLYPKHNIENKHPNEWNANTQYSKKGILNILFLLFVSILKYIYKIYHLIF